MVMAPREILREYRTAQDQKKQIKILAELNVCGVGEIINVLEDGGEKVDGRWYKRERLERAAPAEEEKESKEEETPHPSRAERVPPSPRGEGFGEEDVDADAGTDGEIATSPQAAPRNDNEGDEDETATARDVLPTLIRMAAVETIAERLADVGRSDEDNAEAFCEQVRGILALVYEVERRCEG